MKAITPRSTTNCSAPSRSRAICCCRSASGQDGRAIWVTGNILIMQGASVTLTPEFTNHGSGILADNRPTRRTAVGSPWRTACPSTVPATGQPYPGGQHNNSPDDLNPAINVANNAAGAPSPPGRHHPVASGSFGSALSARRLYVDGEQRSSLRRTNILWKVSSDCRSASGAPNRQPGGEIVRAMTGHIF